MVHVRVHRPSVQSRWRGVEGITLVEVVIAIFVFAVALLALASSATASLTALTASQLRQEAYTAATRSIEVARTYAFDELSLGDPDPSAPDASVIDTSGFDPDAGTIDDPAGSDPELLRRAGDLEYPPGDLPLETDLHQQDGNFRLRTFVTVPAGQPDPPLQVRVTALVEFDRRGSVQRVRQSSLISSEELVVYGVEQPGFALVPAVRGLEGERGGEACTRHRVTNTGQTDDSYRVERPSLAQLPDAITAVRVIELHDAGPDRALPNSADLTDSYAPGDELRIEVCYDLAAATEDALGQVELLVVSQQGDARAVAAGQAADPGEDVEEIESRVREQLSQRIFHDVRIERDRRLFLTAEPDDPSEPDPAYALVLPPPEGELLNLSPGASDRPGLLMPRQQQFRWRTVFDAPRTLQNGGLDLWWSSPQRLQGNPAADEQLLVDVEVIHHRSDGSSATVTDGRLTIDLGQLWTPTSTPLPDLTGTQVSEGDALELSMTCAPGQSSNCVLALGSQDQPSALRLVFP